MKRKLLTGLGVSLAAVLTLSACGGTVETPPGVEEAPETSEVEEGGSDEEGAPADAETLTLGVHDEPTDWAPSRLQSILFPYFRQVYEPLAMYDDSLNITPVLATGWEINDAQDSVTISLRDDVVFHSGSPLNADAVATNLEFFADPETGQQMYGPMDSVADWDVVDDTTITVNFKTPIPELQITDLITAWAIGDPNSLDDSSRGVGTGPYEFGEWIAGERIVLERFDGYWGDAPAYQTLHYRVFDDPNAKISAFESGVIQVAIDVPALDANRLEGKATIMTGNPGALIDQWRINPSVAPFDNENVRKAVNYATDREGISNALYHGLGMPLELPYSPDSPAYDKELADSLSFDLDRARELLEESGLSSDELTATILVSSSNEKTKQASQMLQATMAEIGFTLEIDVRDSAEYTEKLLDGDFQILFSGIGNAQKFPTRITTNSIYRLKDNPVGVDDLFPEFAEAATKLNQAVSEEDQAEAIAEFNQVLVDAMWVPTVGSSPHLWLISPDVTGVERDIDNQLLLHGAAPAN